MQLEHTENSWIWLSAPADTREHSPPDVAALGEGRGLDDFGGHPGVGPRCAHLGGLVPFSGQPKIGDLQRHTFHTFTLYGLSKKDWREGREGQWVEKERQERWVRICKQNNNFTGHARLKPGLLSAPILTNATFHSLFLFMLVSCNFNET